MATEATGATVAEDTKERTDKAQSDKALQEAYGEGDEGVAETKAALNWIQRINDALDVRERNTLLSNGISYSRAYIYNQQKAINYAPPRNPKDDREISLGLVHEKIIAFCAIFIKYAFRRRIKVYDENGKMIENLGEFYNLAIEHSLRAEQWIKKIAIIYWELFTQGNAFVLEDWEVRTTRDMDAYDTHGNKITERDMDYTYDYVEKLTYKEGKETQIRRAVSRIMDGRMVIFGNPEIEDVQDQPFICLEEEISRADAEQLYGNLSRWNAVPKSALDITYITPLDVTLFNSQRLEHPENKVIVHRVLDKTRNRMNLLLNGTMMLPRDTPMKIFIPSGNYPLTNFPAERLKGSIYARSIPAKTKFNADFVDWSLKNLALKFEQGILPAILAKGKYTLSRAMFRANQVTHGVAKSDFEKADPENKGVTQNEVTFFDLLKGIVESQTLNPTATGEFDPNASATQIALTDQNQRDKLAFLLDGLAGGFMDMALRRAETIEAKYTIKQKEITGADGKKINVYYNFNVDIGGINNEVIFDDAIGNPDYNHEALKNELHMKAFASRKGAKSIPSEYYIVNPDDIRSGKYRKDVEIVPERIKEVPLQMQEMWAEFTALIQTFGPNVNMEELKAIYLELRGRPAAIFNSEDVMKLKQLEGAQAGAGAPGGDAMQGGNPSPIQPVKNRKTPQKKPALFQ